MYVCNRCGELCEEDDLPTYTEDFGYDTGVGWRSCPQTFVDNCSCGIVPQERWDFGGT